MSAKEKKMKRQALSIKVYAVFFLLIPIILGSCEEENLPEVEITKGLFPMHVGDFWKYGVLPETTIEDSVFIDNQQYFQFSTDNRIIEYFRKEDDKIYRLRPGDQENEVLYYDFTRPEGDSWQFRTRDDQPAWTVTLLSKTETFRKGDLVIENCHVFYFDMAGVIDEESTHWLAPGLGLVRRIGQIGVIDVTEAKVDGTEFSF